MHVMRTIPVQIRIALILRALTSFCGELQEYFEAQCAKRVACIGTGVEMSGAVELNFDDRAFVLLASE